LCRTEPRHVQCLGTVAIVAKEGWTRSNREPLTVRPRQAPAQRKQTAGRPTPGAGRARNACGDELEHEATA